MKSERAAIRRYYERQAPRAAGLNIPFSALHLVQALPYK